MGVSFSEEHGVSWRGLGLTTIQLWMTWQKRIVATRWHCTSPPLLGFHSYCVYCDSAAEPLPRCGSRSVRHWLYRRIVNDGHSPRRTDRIRSGGKWRKWVYTHFTAVELMLGGKLAYGDRDRQAKIWELLWGKSGVDTWCMAFHWDQLLHPGVKLSPSQKVRYKIRQ